MPRRRQPRDLVDLLAAAIADPGPVPDNGRELVAYLGGSTEAKRLISGMAGPPRKADFPDDPAGLKAAQTRWKTASRRVQRWTAPEGRQRRDRAELDAAQKRRARRIARAHRNEAVRRGTMARLRARLTWDSPKAVSSDSRMRTMPSLGGGVAISAQVMDEVLEQLADDDDTGAAETFWEAFADQYGLEPDTQIYDVQWVRIWPEGTPEPKGGS